MYQFFLKKASFFVECVAYLVIYVSPIWYCEINFQTRPQSLQTNTIRIFTVWILDTVKCNAEDNSKNGYQI